ncbi:MAG: long-chain fatty acid--CoA ligase [Burkholderiaceae bacterium]
MSFRHFVHWPEGLPRHLSIPETTICENLEVSAKRFPNKPFLVFYDTEITFSAFKADVDRMAGFLQQRCNIKRGDRVLIQMQNSPQFMLAYYAILRADAVVVPVNPMNLTAELAHFISDSGSKAIFVSQELYQQVRPLLGCGELQYAIVSCYSDYLNRESDLEIPGFLSASRQSITDTSVTLWSDALAFDCRPFAPAAAPDDLCVMPYTSGSTGSPKGCMHSHRTVMATTLGIVHWYGVSQDTTILSVLPFFHVTGMQFSMNAAMFSGSTVVLLPRWDREMAAEFIQRYKVMMWNVTPTMAVDFLSNPRIGEYDLSSVSHMIGGGAAMPEAVAQRLQELCGIAYLEGYGLTETMAPTHLNPPQRPKKQCLGIPMCDTDARVVDPETLLELVPGEVGEIIIHAPQLFQGYWNKKEASADACVTLEGKRFLRTGDLGRTDEEGYFFMVDRLKRMVNASGYKVWPAEIEGIMHEHPAIQEACVIGLKDEYRGETVKAVVVLSQAYRDKVTEQEIIDWARQRMAAYKAPRVVEFVLALPRSGTGKIEWRLLQERENQRTSVNPILAKTC